MTPVSYTHLDVYKRQGVYWSSVEHAVKAQDVRECIIKAVTFGLLTISLCAYHWFNAHRCSSATGARAVSASTTRCLLYTSPPNR